MKKIAIMIKVLILFIFIANYAYAEDALIYNVDEAAFFVNDHTYDLYEPMNADEAAILSLSWSSMPKDWWSLDEETTSKCVLNYCPNILNSLKFAVDLEGYITSFDIAAKAAKEPPLYAASNSPNVSENDEYNWSSLPLEEIGEYHLNLSVSLSF